MCKRFLFVMAILCLFQTVFCQALQPGDPIPEGLTITGVQNSPVSEIQLRDLKGKLVILDFWSTWCTACIAAFPKLHQLQKEFKDEVKIILVNTHPKDSAARLNSLFVKRKERTGEGVKLPFSLQQEHLKEVFPYEGLPHVVWIGPDGKYLGASYTKELSAENIQAVLNKKSLRFLYKSYLEGFDHSLPLFAQDAKFPADKLVFQSTITPYLEGAGYRYVSSKLENGGTWYMYHVRLNNGNRIYVVKMKPDLSDIEPGTAKEILASEKPWENTWNSNWPVAEGPTVIKRSGKYYLMYSTNDFRNPDYAVGYAVSDHPEGPIVKSDDSPIINRKLLGVSGPCHGDLFTTSDGKFKYVFHTHFDRTTVAPRLGAIIDIKFEQGNVNEKIVADPTSFRYLKAAIAQTFRNLLLPSGADPLSYWKDGYYYYTHTLVDRISLWKTKTLTGLTGAKEVTVFRPPSVASNAKDIWAPEIHAIRNKWYIYFSAADNKGRNNGPMCCKIIKSPDGHQDWILYHAKDRPGMGCAQYRSPRAQRFRWKADGSPDFGKPVPLKNPLMVPSAISIQNN